ncbi:hypothetical protein ACRYCC_13240 [Actinomadura scrupuli]|uniref:hypothetical protein n=1 Tax=Actinomadura scrupuli TaxID=559629 RepID=UPI003D9973C5
MDRAFTKGRRRLKLTYHDEDRMAMSRLVLDTTLRSWGMSQYGNAAIALVMAMFPVVRIEGMRSLTVRAFDVYEGGDRQHLVIAVRATGPVPELSATERATITGSEGAARYNGQFTFPQYTRAVSVRLRVDAWTEDG